jgi:hypothetical protein
MVRLLESNATLSLRELIMATQNVSLLGNGTAAVPIQVGGVLNDIVKAPEIEPFRKIDPRQGVDSVLAFVERYKLPEHVREDFLSAYEGDRFVESLALPYRLTKRNYPSSASCCRRS